MDVHPPITLRPEPIDEWQCRFVAAEPFLSEGGRVRFTDPREAQHSRVAAAVLEVAGVCEVVLDGPVLTVRRSATAPPWPELTPRVTYAVEAASTPPASLPAGENAPGDDDAMFDVVSEIFQAQINPTVAQHGGRVELIDVQDATVFVRMQGGCQGCGMAHVTLRQGIEAALRRALPSLRGIRDITDHAAGTSPYFSPTGK